MRQGCLATLDHNTGELSLQMKKFLTLLSFAAVACVTSYPAHAQDVKGNALDGENKAALCIGCHGIQGFHTGFPEVYKVPKISGQSPKYIVSALGAYKRGERKHPSMRGVATTLSDQDMADLAAFYSNNGTFVRPPMKSTDGSPDALALVAKGGCTSCHGDNFSKPIDASYPKIAGQNSDYLYFALKAYKTEGVAQIGRANPIMGGVAKQFSNEELKILAEYVGNLPGQLQTVQPGRFR
jgi:cytochrome c553